jgi:hypothetical protein
MQRSTTDPLAVFRNAEGFLSLRSRKRTTLIDVSTIARHNRLPRLRQARERRGRQWLSLQRTASGWALLDERGHTVFAADGRDARRQCLAHASGLGVLHVRFDEQH